MSRFLIFVSVVCLAASVQAQTAAKLPAKRTVLQRTDVATNPAQETIFGTVDVLPGSGNGFHTHNGSEIGYVLQGHIRLEIRGQASRDLGPGDSFLVTRGLVHRSILLGTEPVKLINTWTVDKDKPLLNLVPDQ
ncbi:MAG TPA: cupin domain-containing protein [Rhizomicrobium sp.]|nr:cupin domain-containing protein [Rhizomicrobium sp.]